MKFALLLTIVSLALANSSWAGHGEGNGGGLAEKNVMYAYLNLGRYIGLCLDSERCQVNGDGDAILRKILRNLGDEVKNDKQIVFASEKEHPGTFIVDGRERVAKTGDEVGSPILINLDLIYHQVGPHEVQAIDVPYAVGILVHELGHHQGISDEQTLYLVGSAIETFVRERSLQSYGAKTAVSCALTPEKFAPFTIQHVLGKPGEGLEFNDPNGMHYYLDYADMDGQIYLYIQRDTPLDGGKWLEDYWSGTFDISSEKGVRFTVFSVPHGQLQISCTLK